MPILGFDHFNLRAPRAVLELLKSFYCEVLGFTNGDRPPFNSFGYWLYVGDSPVLHLSESKEDERRSVGAQNTFDHVALSCTDREATELHLQTLGIEYKIASVPQTKRVQIFLTDPAGNGVELNFDDSRS